MNSRFFTLLRIEYDAYIGMMNNEHNERLHFSDLLSNIEQNPRWTAPYGVLSGEGKSAKGRKHRTITFGVARYLDAHIMYFSPKYIVVQAEGPLAYKFEGLYHSIEEVIAALGA